jgi:hypothetical protein
MGVKSNQLERVNWPLNSSSGCGVGGSTNQSDNMNARPRNRFTSGITILLFTVMCFALRAQNIVQNGAFNSPNGISFPGWTYPGFIFNPGNPPVPGADGGSYVGVSQYILQSLNTTPGQIYELQFSILAKVPYISQPGPYGIDVHWGSEDLGIIQLPSDSSSWVTEQFSVTADSTQTVLDFTQPYGANPWLDAVSVEPIPEPTTATLLIVGMALIAGRMARFQLWLVAA